MLIGSACFPFFHKKLEQLLNENFIICYQFYYQKDGKRPIYEHNQIIGFSNWSPFFLMNDIYNITRRKICSWQWNITSANWPAQQRLKDDEISLNRFLKVCLMYLIASRIPYSRSWTDTGKIRCEEVCGMSNFK